MLNHPVQAASVVLGVLRQPSDFSAALSFKTLKRTDWLSLYLSAQSILSPSLSAQANLGLIVSKQVDKRAVRRNLVKRIIRAWFCQRGFVFAGYNLVIRVHENLNTFSVRAVKQQLWFQLNLLEQDFPKILVKFQQRIIQFRKI